MSTAIEAATTLRPVHDLIIVALKEPPKETAGGIALPASAQRPSGPLEATVKAIGPGARDQFGTIHAVSVSVGQRVYISSYAGIDVKHNGEEVRIIRDPDVLCVIETHD